MILATGATGLSGSAVIREFAQRSAKVRALVRNRTKARAIEMFPTVELVEADMLRSETLGAALDNVDRNDCHGICLPVDHLARAMVLAKQIQLVRGEIEFDIVVSQEVRSQKSRYVFVIAQRGRIDQRPHIRGMQLANGQIADICELGKLLP